MEEPRELVSISAKPGIGCVFFWDYGNDSITLGRAAWFADF